MTGILTGWVCTLKFRFHSCSSVLFSSHLPAKPTWSLILNYHNVQSPMYVLHPSLGLSLGSFLSQDASTLTTPLYCHIRRCLTSTDVPLRMIRLPDAPSRKPGKYPWWDASCPDKLHRLHWGSRFTIKCSGSVPADCQDGRWRSVRIRRASRHFGRHGKRCSLYWSIRQGDDLGP